MVAVAGGWEEIAIGCLGDWVLEFEEAIDVYFQELPQIRAFELEEFLNIFIKSC